MKRIHCFTHGDLDGCVSFLIIKWLFSNDHVSYTTVSNAHDFRNIITNWMVSYNFKDYDQIYVLDLDTQECGDLIDHKNVFIVDHHDSHATNLPEYKFATVAVKQYTSACKLLYKLFEKMYKWEGTKEQKALIALADDYDSYNNEFPLSKQLNIVFWQTNRSFESFVQNFINGFSGFNFHQQNMVDLYFKQLNNIRSTLNVFKGDLKIQDKKYSVYATFASKMINDVADILIEKYKADIAIVVNLNSQRVSFRRGISENGGVNLATLAEELCNGGGHSYAAGGMITDKFNEFTKKLRLLKNK